LARLSPHHHGQQNNGTWPKSSPGHENSGIGNGNGAAGDTNRSIKQPRPVVIKKAAADAVELTILNAEFKNEVTELKQCGDAVINAAESSNSSSKRAVNKQPRITL
jgi:hypothetical protein